MKQLELQILTGSVVPYATHTVDKFLDGYYTLQLMTTGGVELFYDERRYLMEGSWFWPAYPGPHIRFHVAPGYTSWEHRHIAFRGPLVQQWISEGLYAPDPQPAMQEKAYGTLFDELLAQTKRLDYWGMRRVIHMLEGLLIELAEARAQIHPHASWVQELIDGFTQEEADFSPNYERLAQRYHVGVSTMRRQFRESTGIAIHTYVLQCRIARAKTLLISSELPLKAIAERLGYSDVFYFSRQFHEQTGIAPGMYRRSQHLS